MKNILLNRSASSSYRLALGFVGILACSHLWAAGPVLMQGPAVSITADDVKADANLRIPPEAQASVLAKADAVVQMASNLYVRRAMAAQAEADGLASDAAVVSALRVAREKVLSDAYLAKLDEQNKVSDAAAEAFARTLYRAKPERFKLGERVQVRHILVAGSESESRAQAEKILEEVKAGADFASIARERSADKKSGAQGGDLGFFEAGRMVPEFDVAAFALRNPGDISDVVQTKFGYHILQLVARAPAGQKPFEEVREELIAEVRAEAAQKARVNAADNLRAQGHVDRAAVEAFAAEYR